MDNFQLSRLYDQMGDTSSPQAQGARSEAAQQILMNFLMRFAPGLMPSQAPAQPGFLSQGLPNFERARMDAQFQPSPQMLNEAPPNNYVDSVFFNNPGSDPAQHANRLNQIRLMNLFRLLQGTAGQPNQGQTALTPELLDLQRRMGM